MEGFHRNMNQSRKEALKVPFAMYSLADLEAPDVLLRKRLEVFPSQERPVG